MISTMRSLILPISQAFVEGCEGEFHAGQGDRFAYCRLTRHYRGGVEKQLEASTTAELTSPTETCILPVTWLLSPE